jgi:glycine/D-amino acid oxidase-like deaminating enzyme
MTVSYWRRTERLGVKESDLLIVGAGVCGLSAALHARARGLKVIIVEKDRMGSGASTRNAGFLMRGCADNYAAAASQFGRARARALWKLTEDNLRGLRALGVETQPGTRNVPSVLLALREDERDQLRQSVTMMTEDGFDVSWQERGQDSLWRTAKSLGALINPHDASCNSREVLELLRSRLDCELLEGQEVASIDDDGPGLSTRVSDGTIKSRHVLLCTNAYAPLLARVSVSPKRGQMMAIARSDLRLDASYYINFGSEYIRQDVSGNVLVGGCRTYHAEREVGYEDLTTSEVQRDLERFADSVIGPGYYVVARWAGIMGFTQNHLPMICRASTSGSARAWFCGGFTGHGMSMAYRVSEIALSVMLDGAENPFPAST